MSNKIIAGDYQGARISAGFGSASFYNGEKTIQIGKHTVNTYELITDEHRKSAKSGIARGLIGGALLGPVGMLAGGVSAKNKGTYQLAVQWVNGKKSLLEVDDKTYKIIMKLLF